jgi:hypothetical protein
VRHSRVRERTAGNLALWAAGSKSHVRSIPKGNAQRIVQLIREKMAAAHGGAQTTTTVAVDATDQIRKLVALRDEAC